MSARGANHHLRRTSGGGRISAAPEATQHARRPLAKLLEHPRPRQAVGLADEPLIGSNIGSEVPLAGLSLEVPGELPAGSVRLDAALLADGWRIDAFIAAAALPRWDPAEVPRLACFTAPARAWRPAHWRCPAPH